MKNLASLKFIFRKATLLLFLLTAVGCATKQDHLVIRLNGSVLDAFIRDVYTTHPIPGMTVGIVTADTSYVRSAGYADVSAQVPVSDTTPFFAGAFSELLVATAFLSAEAHGDLLLTDKVKKHLPYFAMQGMDEEVSLHHLLTHTSGIPNFSPAWDMPTFEEDALEGTTRSIVFQELEFTPGSRCKRAPYNYDIAADLLSKSSGSAFELVMKKLLDRLNMPSSGYDVLTAVSCTMAQPHEMTDWLAYEQGLSEIYPYTRENAGSFGFRTTSGDMVSWMRHILHMEGSALPHQVTDGLLGRHYQTSEHVYKGYGWDILELDGAYIYRNTWSEGGFSGDLILIPSRKTGIVVMANTADDFNPASITDHIVHHLKGGELQTVKPPIHIEMSRRLAVGRSIAEVLNWYDSLSEVSNPAYLVKPELLGQLGVNLLYRLGKPEDALQVFRFAVEKYPDSQQAHFNLTEGLLALEKIEDAQAHFEIALGLKDQPATRYVELLRERLNVAMENQTSS